MEQLYYHGTILPMSEEAGETEALLVRDGKIAALGSLNELTALTDHAVKIDLEGKTLLPGFIDGHSHLSAVAYQMTMANLNPPPTGECSSVEDVVRVLQEKLLQNDLEPGQWLIGMGYDNSVYPNGVHPTRWDLDQVSTQLPVAALHTSGHLCAVNSRAMELLGYLNPQADIPEGGVVEESGLLKEQAFLSPEKQRLMQSVSPVKVLEYVGKASELYASYGITTAQDGRTTLEERELLLNAGRLGTLKTDVVMYLMPEAAARVLPRQNPAQNEYEHHLRAAGMKFFLDGSPQGKTAWLSRPYQIVPEDEAADYRGVPTMKEEEVLDLMRQAIANHWQINVHANGDEAIEQMIRCYQQALAESGSDERLRPVIIHCQTVRQDQLERMSKIGILASFFLDHVYYWGDYHRDSVLGPERAFAISPLSSALAGGVSFTMHQDAPVVPPNPIFSIHNAVNRRTSSGKILGENERISVYEALKAVTVNGAYQIFEENSKGRLKEGFRADFVILSKNPLQVASDQLSSIEVLETIKDGETIYKKQRTSE